MQNQQRIVHFINYLRGHMKNLLASFLAALVFCFPALASTGDPIELQNRFGYYHAAYLVNEDGTVVESHEWSKTVLKETALESSKSASVSYSTSAQKAEVVAAYTLKADGRRLDVPKNNYQIESNSGKGKDSPVYSDWTTLSVVFPDVAVGDTVVFSFKLIQTEAMFPGQYSAAQYFSDQVAYDDVRVRFDYPASMWVQHEARGMKETVNETKGDRKIIEWSYANPKPIKNERRDYSVFDSDKAIGLSFSTFKTYADISAAYGKRALPKAAVTDRITKLAAEIVKDKTAPKEQARALYEWVATNITYAGNCIGIGAVVPRDTSFTLDNKMGDCKDHATLLQALLAARGIKSTQALINAGSAYQLPKIPVVSTVNHVINYLPAFDLYLDSTSDSTPFGLLPYSDQDKSVLLVEGFKDGAKTPVAPAGSNKQITKSIIKIAADGSVTGSMEIFQNGLGAIQMRSWARDLTKEVEDDLVKNMYRRQGLIGSGKLVKDDPKELLDNYHYKVSFNAEKFVKLPGAGAFYIHHPLNMASPIYSHLQSTMEPEEVDVTCSDINTTEEFVIELPKTVKVLSIPDNLKIANDFVSYTATYKLKGNVITAKRTLDDRTKGNVCKPQVFVEYKKIAEKAIDNLKEQVLYK
jgi:transglutaminase-like putative cysteine protease